MSEQTIELLPFDYNTAMVKLAV